MAETLLSDRSSRYHSMPPRAQHFQHDNSSRAMKSLPMVANENTMHSMKYVKINRGDYYHTVDGQPLRKRAKEKKVARNDFPCPNCTRPQASPPGRVIFLLFFFWPDTNQVCMVSDIAILLLV